VITLPQAVERVLEAREASGKPLAVVVAGHNGSGKSTLWYERLAPVLRIPLLNADRMMMSILPEVARGERLPDWASVIRDQDPSWMLVAQKGVEAFVAQALTRGVPFAMETVFSYWEARPDGTVASKVDLIRQMQAAGYFVLLLFVGLTDSQLSVGRVQTRVAKGGHGVDPAVLEARFPRTQRAIGAATAVADTVIMMDNSRDPKLAFTPCRVVIAGQPVFDLRDGRPAVAPAILSWLEVVSPRPDPSVAA
jgi:predicted ABC-type ATPase